MPKNLDSTTEKCLLEFVRKRVAYIRDGLREKLNSTYCPCCLNRRNETNSHDYDFYRSLIEDGFGVVQQVTIVPHGDQSKLPLRGLCHYVHSLDCVLRLSTVSDRQTLWPIHFRDDTPFVALPVFNGQCFDSIATGTDLRLKGEMPTRPLVVQFDDDHFALELSKRIYLELNQVKFQLKPDRIRALAIACAPWHSSMSLCILTDREYFDEDSQLGKWDTAEWRYSDFTDTPNSTWPYAKDLMELMGNYYESDSGADYEERADRIFRACAKALLSKKVAEALRKYEFNLSEDFEFGVFNPDDFEKGNYCRMVDPD